MFKIIKGDQTLAIVAKPKWVRLQSNGSFALCSENEAGGVVVGGEVYRILGRAELPDKEDVSVIEIDAGNIIDDITALQLAAAELAEAQAADQTANELALAELAEIVLGG
jgi:hypothetical protein